MISLHRRLGRLLAKPADRATLAAWLARAEALAPRNAVVRRERALLQGRRSERPPRPRLLARRAGDRDRDRGDHRRACHPRSSGRPRSTRLGTTSRCVRPCAMRSVPRSRSAARCSCVVEAGPDAAFAVLRGRLRCRHACSRSPATPTPSRLSRPPGVALCISASPLSFNGLGQPSSGATVNVGPSNSSPSTRKPAMCSSRAARLLAARGGDLHRGAGHRHCRHGDALQPAHAGERGSAGRASRPGDRQFADGGNPAAGVHLLRPGRPLVYLDRRRPGTACRNAAKRRIGAEGGRDALRRSSLRQCERLRRLPAMAEASRTSNNNTIAGLGGYRATVTVAKRAPILRPGRRCPSDEALLITMTRSGPANVSVVLQGYRLRYAPNAP